MNFHPDKQLFQVAGAGDRTTDTMEDPFLILIVLLFYFSWRNFVQEQFRIPLTKTAIITF
jgi:hypothetical protein